MPLFPMQRFQPDTKRENKKTAPTLSLRQYLDHQSSGAPTLSLRQYLDNYAGTNKTDTNGALYAKDLTLRQFLDQHADNCPQSLRQFLDTYDDNTSIDDIDADIDRISQIAGTLKSWWREDSTEREEPYEEEQEITAPVQGGIRRAGAGGGATMIDRARLMFQQLYRRPNITRADIIASFEEDLQATHSTAVSYYERIAREMGLTNQEDDDAIGGMGGRYGAMPTSSNLPSSANQVPELKDDVSSETGKKGLTRRVPGAHLVYKRQSPNGTFEELWIYNITDTIRDGIKVRRAILAGTDIPRNKTRSDDGQQAYQLNTMGNAQLLHITGLPN